MKRPNDSGAHAHEALRPATLLLTLTVCACFAGCSFLKPAPDTARHFVLTPLPRTQTANVAIGASGVGVVHVRIPTYLFNSSLAIRKGANEIDYSSVALWAERLDTGIPRVLTADLTSLLPREHQVRLSVGRSEDFATEISVTIEQFDVSSSGQAVLVANWHVLSPEGEGIQRSGESRLSRNGPAPDTDPSGAINTLSDLIADLSRQLAQALKDT
jgi:uncharacterized lipoprotein YmbA